MVELDGRYRFENFVVGSANRLAVAAARAVADAPGAAYNPLFIYSSSGLGKTHLLAASGHHARQLQPGVSVCYVTLDEFVDQLHAAIATGSMDTFKERYHSVDMLLLDDVQFLAGRRETQSEILRLFNALQQSGRQIVLACDRPPSEIADLDERLITRLSGGLVVDIGEPDYETRVAILRRKCDERGARFETGVIEELARKRFGNVRELQGALNRLLAVQMLERAQVTPSVARLGGGDTVMSPQPAVVAPGAGEFEQFLSDLSAAVASQLDSWRAQLVEKVGQWSGRGYRTTWLERGLDAADAPQADALIAEYESAIERLQSLEKQAIEIDPALAAAGIFRDPERLQEAEEMTRRVLAAVSPLPGPEPRLSRATFEVGPFNELAAQAADAVARQPGSKYNPLFLYGPAGAGKTHLAHAVGVELLAQGGHSGVVVCVDARTLGDELIAALQEGTIGRWRARYRSVDALILDDVQVIADTERTQEEVFHLFNALHASGRQIVLTSDRPPEALAGLDDRLRSRFEGGLVVQMLPRRQQPAAWVSGAANSATPPPGPPGAGRGLDPFFLDPEKVTWEWPELGDRALEEIR